LQVGVMPTALAYMSFPVAVNVVMAWVCTLALDGATVMLASAPGLTVTLAVPDALPEVARTVLLKVPAAVPAVNRPVMLTPPPPLTTLHVTGAPGIGVPALSVTVAVNCWVPLMASVTF